ncbi:DegT/DnrJ/EryC1/StrS family aminotransferase [Sphingomonas sp. SUN019]|uniref:DegT/DnrJ/EryC1/StrS family aminotransferase n=1 Tax=Sphingomonas sp. SUN019 TaxID=2937788 RepID=UPI0021645FB1|nr:DegT/DnrJ/EryC1/StrS family aminotransferase [Sphingomonas sp. SUN019]UVO52292.1 DegT/DnrJ/EryC1/StrS family aminotransferase [Sphingomonas sp. SUN019]
MKIDTAIPQSKGKRRSAQHPFDGVAGSNVVPIIPATQPFPMAIPFLRPQVVPVEAWTPFLVRSYDAAFFTNRGPLETSFSAACADRYAAPGYACVTATNATAGLTAALLALPWPAGRQPCAIIPAFTFPATLHAVLHAGWRAILCDADPVKWEMDVKHLERLLAAGDIDAVMPVRSFGFVRDLSPIIDLATRHGARVVIDGAAAFGNSARRIGSAAGEIEVASLHATKTFAIGEGGLVFAPADMADAMRRISNFGIESPHHFGDGGNMKLDDFRAAIGLATLDRIDAVVDERTALAEEYAALLAGRGSIATIAHDVGPTPWQCFPARFADAATCTRAFDQFAARGIATRRYYAPALASGYRGSQSVWFDPAQTPVAERLATEMLCLPIWIGMSAAERDYTLGSVSNVLATL